MRRTLAVALIVATVFVGSGLPRCVMHEHASGHAGHGPQMVADHGQHGDLGCAAGGTCPAGSAAAPFTAAPVITAPELAREVPRAIDRAYRSFLSPPPAPPPQT